MKRILCYAEGHGDQWEAFCLDFDLAVQGKSLPDVRAKLADQIGLYLESVWSMPAAERDAFLNRRAPLKLRLRFAWLALCTLFRGQVEDQTRVQYPEDVPAQLAQAA